MIESPAPGILREIEGDAIEIQARFDSTNATATRFGIEVRRSRDGKERTIVYYEPRTDSFGIDGLVSRRPGSPGRGSAGRRPGEPVELRIFLDRSVIEVFVNGRAITERMFPSPESRGIEVFAEGGRIRLESVDIWEMAPIWPIDDDRG